MLAAMNTPMSTAMTITAITQPGLPPPPLEPLWGMGTTLALGGAGEGTAMPWVDRGAGLAGAAGDVCRAEHMKLMSAVVVWHEKRRHTEGLFT